ncbi:hypothetical protein E3Q09_03695 [Wallemia mellicola]|nr:hypothetical protein E3Q09_03695 [Wallemia mellicola]
MSNDLTPEIVMVLVDVTEGPSNFVRPMLSNPEEYQAKELSGAAVLYIMIWIADIFCNIMLFVNEFGYSSSKTNGEVDWIVKQADGPPTEFEKYLDRFYDSSNNIVLICI